MARINGDSGPIQDDKMLETWRSKKLESIRASYTDSK
jgi:hypothetical protein